LKRSANDGATIKRHQTNDAKRIMRYVVLEGFIKNVLKKVSQKVEIVKHPDLGSYILFLLPKHDLVRDSS
jgi:hypothetical protein